MNKQMKREVKKLTKTMWLAKIKILKGSEEY